ncbi:hypothetical protein H920_08833 [Fukomys damarensis]|uniref:Uncharacterized protein n=1 Tax=Fukomys damarensis TaxID=885580 RepID=A0A091DGR4_FUKDA|nr:hypothetical protein H920_08833 [Fukomys damarensis]
MMGLGWKCLQQPPTPWGARGARRCSAQEDRCCRAKVQYPSRVQGLEAQGAEVGARMHQKDEPIRNLESTVQRQWQQKTPLLKDCTFDPSQHLHFLECAAMQALTIVSNSRSLFLTNRIPNQARVVMQGAKNIKFHATLRVGWECKSLVDDIKPELARWEKLCVAVTLLSAPLSLPSGFLG